MHSKRFMRCGSVAAAMVLLIAPCRKESFLEIKLHKERLINEIRLLLLESVEAEKGAVLAVSDEERTKRKKAAETKLIELKGREDDIVKFEKQAAKSLDEQSRRMRGLILDEIRNLLNAKAKTGGFTLVVDTAAETANNTPIVLYTNGENDLTSDILKQLNLGAPADPAKPDGNGAAEKTSDKK